MNPQYALLKADTFREMAGLGQSVKFIFLMRDPIGRIHSRLNQKLGKFADGATEPAPEIVRDVYEKALAQGEDSDVIRRSRYDLTIQELESAVPAADVAYFFYETFFTPAEQRRLSEFLGIAHRDGNLDKRVFKSKGTVRAFPADLDAKSLEFLRPAYDYLLGRFDGQIPTKWRRP